MKSLWRTTAASVMALLLGSAVHAAERHDRLLTMLTGAFDNNEQVWQQAEDEVAQDERTHYRFAGTEDPNTLTLASAPGQTAQDPAWRWAFETRKPSKPGQAVVIASTVSAADGQGRACEWRWQRSGEGYQGRPAPGARCNRALPTALAIDSDYLVVSTRNKQRHAARRVIVYKGWMSLKRQQIEPAAADDDFIFVRDVRMHNEGFKAPLRDQDGQPTGYTIELARLTQQTTQTAVLKIGVIEDATGKTLRYAWADPLADRIGINLRWLTTGFTRASP